MPIFTYTIDGETQTTTAHELTAAQILTSAGIDTQTHYLVQMEGNQRISYEGKPGQIIHMHEHMKFISVSTGPTPVS